MRSAPERTLLASLGADMVGKSRNMSADMLFTPGLLALMPPTICCVRLQSVRDFVTEISGGATTGGATTGGATTGGATKLLTTTDYLLIVLTYLLTYLLTDRRLE